jgi:transcriptional regulator with XRE-family HTH domain
MTRINLDHLPLSSDQARAARNYFGWSQAKAAEESGLPIHKIKRFEAGNYIPDHDFLNDLRAFFEKRGYQFEDTPIPGEKAKTTGQVFPGGVVGDTTEDQGEAKPYRERTGAAKVHHMRIALQDEGEMGRVLDLIEENEEKAAELLRNEVKSGFLSAISEETAAQHAEAVRLLAENGMLFAKLMGRHIGGKPTAETLQASKDKPNTMRDLLHTLQADAHLAAAGDADAKERRKARKPARSISQALGLS